MMTDEDSYDPKEFDHDSNPEVADKKGQMLVIYLPEGSVIVDRTDVSLADLPKTVIQQNIEESIVALAPTQVVVQAAVEPTPQVPVQPSVQEIVRLVVQEMLHTTGQVPVQANVQAPAKIATPTPKHSHRPHLPKRRKINWAHGINTAFVLYITLVAIVPAVMTSAFGIGIYASKIAHPGASISKGDLMISELIPAPDIKVNDVLLVRDSNTWFLDVRQVSSNTSSGGLATIATAATSGSPFDKTYVLSKNSNVFRIMRTVPILGFVPIILASTITKVLGGLFLLVMNLYVHFRRARRRREAGIHLGLRTRR